MPRIFLTLFLVVIFSSCIVSKKKYDDLLAQKVRMEADLADRNSELDRARTDITGLNDRVRELQEDTMNLGIDIRRTSEQLASLGREHEQLGTNYKNLLGSSGRLNRDMAQQQQQLLAIQENLERTRKRRD